MTEERYEECAQAEAEMRELRVNWQAAVQVVVYLQIACNLAENDLLAHEETRWRLRDIWLEACDNEATAAAQAGEEPGQWASYHTTAKMTITTTTTDERGDHTTDWRNRGRALRNIAKRYKKNHRSDKTA